MQAVLDADEDDEDIELVPVPMDRHTRGRLARFCKVTGQAGAAPAAGQLLKDLLRDVTFWEELCDEPNGENDAGENERTRH
jgi:hypothetical protein